MTGSPPHGRWADLGRGALVALWLAGLVAYVNRGVGGDGLLVALVVVTALALGVLVDRWWAPALPFVAATAVATWSVLTQSEGDYHGFPDWGVFAVAYTVALPPAALMTLGVGFRRLRESGRR